MNTWILSFLCAVGAGILSAWGVGGGTLLLLFLTLFLKMEQQTAQGINLLFFLSTAAAALCFHQKNGRLNRAVLRSLLPWAIPSALLGALLAVLMDPAWLRRPLGVFFLFSAFSLYRSKK